MRLLPLPLIAALLLTGCESTVTKRKDAVVQAIPPRINVDGPLPGGSFVNDPLDPAVTGFEPGEEIRQVGGIEESRQFDSISGGRADLDNQVVATVNGAPIFASEILGRYGQQLEKARQQLPPDQFRQLRLSLIQRDLKPRLERKLLVESMRRSLKPEQIKAIESQLDVMFAKEMEKLQEELQVNSRLELEQELQKRGSTLASLHDDFANQRMAMEYLGVKVKADRKFSRQDLLKYYNDHAADYSHPERVEWQQIQISFKKHGGREKALEKLNEIVSQLKQGTAFDELARKYSDGPTAADGGRWDWTQKGSLADRQVENELFTLPVGKIGQIQNDTSFQLLRVLDRKAAGQTPFETLQAEIQAKLEQQAQREAIKEVLDELFASAVIETIFDDDPASKQ